MECVAPHLISSWKGRLRYRSRLRMVVAVAGMGAVAAGRQLLVVERAQRACPSPLQSAMRCRQLAEHHLQVQEPHAIMRQPRRSTWGESGSLCTYMHVPTG